MGARLAFGLGAVAAIAMLAIATLMAVTAPSCSPLPMSTLTAFELVRSVGDLQRIFGMPGDACRAALATQLDHANMINSVGYIPAYTAFYGLVVYALERRDRMIGWIVTVAVALGCAVAETVRRGTSRRFQLSAAPDAESPWILALTMWFDQREMGGPCRRDHDGWRDAGATWWPWVDRACRLRRPAGDVAVGGRGARCGRAVPDHGHDDRERDAAGCRSHGCVPPPVWKTAD